jgi:glutaredoxin
MGDPDSDRPNGDRPDRDLPAVVVYWRPGCWYCKRLFGGLDRAGIPTERRNIWEDDEARRFVREHNRGNETVPTVAFGDQVLTNPSPAVVIESVLGSRLEGLGDPAPGWAKRLFGS